MKGYREFGPALPYEIKRLDPVDNGETIEWKETSALEEEGFRPY